VGCGVRDTNRGPAEEQVGTQMPAAVKKKRGNRGEISMKLYQEKKGKKGKQLGSGRMGGSSVAFGI